MLKAPRRTTDVITIKMQRNVENLPEYEVNSTRTVHPPVHVDH